jgi:hypothetical protein
MAMVSSIFSLATIHCLSVEWSVNLIFRFEKSQKTTKNKQKPNTKQTKIKTKENKQQKKQKTKTKTYKQTNKTNKQNV